VKKRKKSPGGGVPRTARLSGLGVGVLIQCKIRGHIG